MLSYLTSATYVRYLTLLTLSVIRRHQPVAPGNAQTDQSVGLLITRGSFWSSSPPVPISSILLPSAHPNCSACLRSDPPRNPPETETLTRRFLRRGLSASCTNTVQFKPVFIGFVLYYPLFWCMKLGLSKQHVQRVWGIDLEQFNHVRSSLAVSYI